MVLEPTRFPVRGDGWLVVETAAGEVHVLPGHDVPALGHRAVIACPSCQPIPVRAGPLDEPVWTHYEPGWPGQTTARPLA